jgi:hypothetical protein
VREAPGALGGNRAGADRMCHSDQPCEDLASGQPPLLAAGSLQGFVLRPLQQGSCVITCCIGDGHWALCQSLQQQHQQQDRDENKEEEQDILLSVGAA